jgi:hypothetical protein
MTKTKILWMMMVATMFGGCFATGPLATSPELCDGESPDSFSCTEDICNADTGMYVGVTHDMLCGAGRFCRPEAVGHDAAGCVGTPPPVTCTGCVPDAFACTNDFCDAGTCRHVAVDDRCDGAEICRANAADGASGCYLPPPAPTCATGCDDGVACTIDRCNARGECVWFAEPSLCGASQHCDDRRGCVDDATPPPPVGAFECAFYDGDNHIGKKVRLCTRGLHGVSTVPNRAGESTVMANASMRTWLDEGDVPAGGCRDYDLTGLTGGINTHPFIGEWRVARTGHPEWNLDILNVADFRPVVGHSAASVGLEAYVCQRASGICAESDWVVLPEEFYTLQPDTVGASFWSGDPNLATSLLGTVAIRAVLETGCEAGHPTL